jgi:lycopene beta-cyclase
MVPEVYDAVFVGGGLSATLLLDALRPLPFESVAVVDPHPPDERPPIHLSYWSREPTPYDRHALGVWNRARVAGREPEQIAPFTMRLVRSTDALADASQALEHSAVYRLRTTARSIARRADGSYVVLTDDGVLRARWVFDSACGVAPAFPSPHRPRAVLSGTGIRVEADRPMFDAGTATLFDPLDENSFAYLLPLSSAEALLESASFGPAGVGEDRAPLLRYLRTRHPDAGFTVTHSEYGAIPLRFAPPRTAGQRHVLIGAKRGLVKPSAGYGVVRLAQESERLGRLWRQHLPLPPSRRTPWPWGLLDMGSWAARRPGPQPAAGLAEPRLARDPPRPVAGLHRRAALATTIGSAPPVGRPRRAPQALVAARQGVGHLVVPPVS